MEYRMAMNVFIWGKRFQDDQDVKHDSGPCHVSNNIFDNFSV